MESAVPLLRAQLSSILGWVDRSSGARTCRRRDSTALLLVCEGRVANGQGRAAVGVSVALRSKHRVLATLAASLHQATLLTREIALSSRITGATAPDKRRCRSCEQQHGLGPAPFFRASSRHSSSHRFVPCVQRRIRCPEGACGRQNALLEVEASFRPRRCVSAPSLSAPAAARDPKATDLTPDHRGRSADGGTDEFGRPLATGWRAARARIWALFDDPTSSRGVRACSSALCPLPARPPALAADANSPWRHAGPGHRCRHHDAHCRIGDDFLPRDPARLA